MAHSGYSNSFNSNKQGNNSYNGSSNNNNNNNNSNNSAPFTQSSVPVERGRVGLRFGPSRAQSTLLSEHQSNSSLGASVVSGQRAQETFPSSIYTFNTSLSTNGGMGQSAPSSTPFASFGLTSIASNANVQTRLHAVMSQIYNQAQTNDSVGPKVARVVDGASGRRVEILTKVCNPLKTIYTAMNAVMAACNMSGVCGSYFLNYFLKDCVDATEMCKYPQAKWGAWLFGYLRSKNFTILHYGAVVLRGSVPSGQHVALVDESDQRWTNMFRNADQVVKILKSYGFWHQFSSSGYAYISDVAQIIRSELKLSFELDDFWLSCRLMSILSSALGKEMIVFDAFVKRTRATDSFEEEPKFAAEKVVLDIFPRTWVQFIAGAACNFSLGQTGCDTLDGALAALIKNKLTERVNVGSSDKVASVCVNFLQTLLSLPETAPSLSHNYWIESESHASSNAPDLRLVTSNKENFSDLSFIGDILLATQHDHTYALTLFESTRFTLPRLLTEHNNAFVVDIYFHAGANESENEFLNVAKKIIAGVWDVRTGARDDSSCQNEMKNGAKPNGMDWC